MLKIKSQPYWFELSFLTNPPSHIIINSKPCHLKNFGTRDLRHANLPNAAPPNNIDRSQTSSPVSSPTKNVFSPQALLRPLSTGGTPLPRLRPNRSLATSPISPTFLRGSSPTSPAFQLPLFSTPTGSEGNPSTTPVNDNTIREEEEKEVHDVPMAGNDDPLEQEEDRDFVSESSTLSYPSNTGRPGIGTIPRTIPLYLNNGNGSRTGYKHYTSHSVGSVPSNYSPTKGEGEQVEDDLVTKSFSESVPRTALDRNLGTYGNFTPLKQTSTGTRYGVALTGGVGVHMTGSASPSPRKWGAGTPVCPRCMKNVYFAEQVSLYLLFLFVGSPIFLHRSRPLAKRSIRLA